MPRFGAGPRNQDLPDFDPNEAIPTPPPLPSEAGDLQYATANDLDQVGAVSEAPVSAPPSMTMPPMGPGPDMPDPTFGSAEEPAPPSLPNPSPNNPYALPGSRASRPYRSRNLMADDGFDASQGFGGGGGGMNPEDDELIKSIVSGMKR